MFSELVDTALARSGRTDRFNDIVGWSNLTLKEVFGKRLLTKNLIEDTLDVDQRPFIWVRPNRLQKLRTLKFTGTMIYPDFIQPGRRQRDYVNYYYAAAGYYVVNGRQLGSQIDVAYYQFPKYLQYFAVGQRPATYNFATEEWTYYDLSQTGKAPFNKDYTLVENQAEAEGLVSNWLLKDWNEMCIEGALAKIFKGVNDETRSATHYSFFNQFVQGDFFATEAEASAGA